MADARGAVKGERRWVGASTLAKPVYNADTFTLITDGEEYYEIDTGKNFVYMNGTWTEKMDKVFPWVWDTTTLAYVKQTQTTLVTDNVTVSGTMDLTKIGGAAVGVTNPLFVSTQKPLTPQAPASVSVDLVSEVLVTQNLTRKGMIVTNTSTTAYVSLGFGVDAVLYKGVTLWPGGTFWMDEFSLSTLEVRAIASAAATVVAVQDFAV